MVQFDCFLYPSLMDTERINAIKVAAIQALVSDDMLMNKLILKGGNALDLIHKIAERASFDLDFSLEGSFDDTRLPELEEKVGTLLTSTFREQGYHVFDVSLRKRPSQTQPDLDSFWGGYKIEFKLISLKRYEELKSDTDQVLREAIPVGQNNSTKLRIEISRFEHCPTVEHSNVGGFMVRVYSPVLIAIEKLRAICQQMKEYSEIVRSSKASPRARDFFDIYTVVTTCKVDLLSQANKDLLCAVFEAKRVPLAFLTKVREYRDYHSEDFVAVKDTIKPSVKLHDFDFYFDFVADICDELQP